MTYNLFVTSGYKPIGPAREEHQHDRRSAGLELVHQPHRHQAGHDRRASSRGANRRRAARPVAVGAHQGEDVRRASGLHGEGREGRDLVPRVRSAVLPGRRDRGRRGRDEDLLGARLQPGGIVPDDVRSEERVEIDPKATIRRPTGKRTPFTQDDINAILERVARNAGRHAIASSPAGCCPARSSAASSTPARVPTIPTTSSRTSTAASCARCASSARGRTSPISRPRTRSTRSSPRTARSIVKHYLQDVGSTFGMCNDFYEWDLSWEHFYQGDTVVEAPLLVRVRAEPVADGRLRRVPVDRQVRGRASSIPRSGGRRRRRRPTWSCATTTRSGRRGGSRRSPTT